MTNETEKLNKIRDYFEISDNNPRSYYDRGFAEFNEGFNEEALQDLNKALELGFNQGIVMGKLYYALGSITSNELGDELNAIKYFSKAIEYCPTDPRLYHWRGASYIASSIKEYHKAIKDFDMAIKCSHEIDIEPIQEMYYYRGYAKWKLGLDWKKDYDKSNEPTEFEKEQKYFNDSVENFNWDSYEIFDDYINIK